MLVAARARMAGATNVEFREGDLLALPAKDGEFDAAVLMLVLHHVVDVVPVLREVRRVLRAGGVLLVVDMVAHGHEDYRLTMGHQHLGFAEESLAASSASAGFGSVRYRRLRAATDRKGPGLFAAAMRR
jgi:ubiquinone/menaquinone biosynthesis C-methylase UbiE